MNNDQAQVYVNDRVRPRAEFLRAALGILIDDVQSYDADTKSFFAPATGASAYRDLRADVPRLAQATDVDALLGAEARCLAILQDPAVMAAMSRLCVRPVAVQ